MRLGCSQHSLQQEMGQLDFLNHFDFSHLQDEREKAQLVDFLSGWRSLFALQDHELGRTTRVKHRIHLNDPNREPIKQRHRRVPHSMYEEVKQHLKTMLECGVIQHSNSPWRSPVVLVRKSDGSLRFCVDYRKLNHLTRKDAYEIPCIEETLDSLHGSKYFSCLDLKAGYWQVAMHEDDKALTAFSCGPLGFYEFNVMPFGLSNSPATFQRLMEQCLGDLHLKKCLIFLDDIIVFSSTLEEHLENLQAVFQRLNEFGLRLKPSKCKFFREKVRYLGYVVSKEGIEVDPNKVEVLKQMKSPASVQELQRFLGFLGFNRKFIRNFARIAKPLYELLQEGRPFVWEFQQEEAMRELIAKVCSAPVLAFADFSSPFVLQVDASTTGIGAVLCQKQEGEDRVIAYASRSVSKAEQRYPAHKLEFLGLKWAVCDKFHDYLYGRRFEVLTDNNPLTYVLTTARLDAAGHRWVAALTSFDFGIHYQSGKSNVVADFLSRLHTPEEVKAVLQSPVVEEAHILSLTTVSPDCLEALESPVIGRLNVAGAQDQDPSVSVVKQAVIARKKLGPLKKFDSTVRRLMDHWPKLLCANGVLYRHATIQGQTVLQLVVPERLRPLVLEKLHDECGHQGRDRTADLVQTRFFWPGWRQSVVEHIQKCRNCVCRKTPLEQAPLVPIESFHPLDLVCMDFHSLEPSRGFGNVLVITDHFTKFVVTVATKNQTAVTTARALYENFFVRYGIPVRLHSDQGANFMSKVLTELSKIFGVERSRTSVYHPMGNGLCERYNRTLLNMLGCLEIERKKDWKEYLVPLTHAYNCTPHASTGYSPYELLFGRCPRLPVDVQFGLDKLTDQQTSPYSEYVRNLRRRMMEAWRLARKHQELASARQKQVFDHRQRGVKLQVGDMVLVKRLAFDGTHKLVNCWQEEEHRVISQPDVQVQVYVVQPVSGGKKRTLHRNHLLPLRQTLTVSPLSLTGSGARIQVDETVRKRLDTQEEEEEDDFEHAQAMPATMRSDPVHQVPVAAGSGEDNSSTLEESESGGQHNGVSEIVEEGELLDQEEGEVQDEREFVVRRSSRNRRAPVRYPEREF